MQVLIVIVDDNGQSESFQLEGHPKGDSPNFVRFKAGNMSSRIIYQLWVAKDFKASKKN